MEPPDLLKSLLFGISLTATLHYVKHYQKAVDAINHINKTSVSTWQDIKAQKKNERDFVLLKDHVVPFRSNEYRTQFDISSNMVFYNQIPISKFRRIQYYELIQQQLQLKTVKLKNYPQPVSILNFATTDLIQTTKYSYASIFDSKERPGFFGTIFKWTMATIAAIAQPFLQIFLGSSRKQPIISGPLWGKLTLVSKLITNAPLILLCHIKDGKLQPQVAGLNKQDIVEWFEREKHYSFISIIAGLFLMYKLRSVVMKMFRNVKQIWNSFSIRSQKNLEKKEFEAKVKDEQQCIVCYSRCRNVIIRKCRHFILCNDCISSEENPVEDCPLCRVSIDGDIIKVMKMEQKFNEFNQSGKTNKYFQSSGEINGRELCESIEYKGEQNFNHMIDGKFNPKRKQFAIFK